VRWNAYDDPVSPALTFIALDRAATIEAATPRLRGFQVQPRTSSSPTRAGVRLTSSPEAFRTIPSRAMVSSGKRSCAAVSGDPIRAAAEGRAITRRSGVDGEQQDVCPKYRLALSPQFATPYRAYRIAQLLRARRMYDVEYFTQMQLDVLSLPERDLAHDVSKALGDRDAPLAAQLAA